MKYLKLMMQIQFKINHFHPYNLRIKRAKNKFKTFNKKIKTKTMKSLKLKMLIPIRINWYPQSKNRTRKLKYRLKIFKRKTNNKKINKNRFLALNSKTQRRFLKTIN